MKLNKTNQKGLYEVEMSDKDILDSIIRLEKKKDILSKKNKDTKDIDAEISKFESKLI